MPSRKARRPYVGRRPEADIIIMGMLVACQLRSADWHHAQHILVERAAHAGARGGRVSGEVFTIRQHGCKTEVRS